jgi:alpha-1,3-rhamnosyl/mannosyltransferase
MMTPQSPVNLRVGVDIAVLRSPLTGIGNYQHALLQALGQLAPGVTYRGFDRLHWVSVDQELLARVEARRPGSGPDGQGEALRSGKAIRHAIFVWARSNRHVRALRDFARAQAFTYSIPAQKLDLFHAFTYRPPGKANCPVVPVVHDLSTERYPETHPAGRIEWMRPVADLCRKAPVIHTVSEFSAGEIVEVYGIERSRIHVIHPGVNPLFRRKSDKPTDILTRLGLRAGEFFLAVSTIEPRKNFRILIEAFSRLPPGLRQRFPLVVVGAKGWGDARLPGVLDELLQEASVKFAGFVPNEALRDLYEGTRALFYPSIYEGFGMPITEALACGAPVVTSSVSSMPEAGGPFARLVDPMNVDGWTAEFSRAIEADDHLDLDARSSRQKYTEAFSWEAASAKTLAMYEAALAR